MALLYTAVWKKERSERRKTDLSANPHSWYVRGQVHGIAILPRISINEPIRKLVAAASSPHYASGETPLLRAGGTFSDRL